MFLGSRNRGTAAAAGAEKENEALLPRSASTNVLIERTRMVLPLWREEATHKVPSREGWVQEPISVDSQKTHRRSPGTEVVDTRC